MDSTLVDTGLLILIRRRSRKRKWSNQNHPVRSLRLKTRSRKIRKLWKKMKIWLPRIPQELQIRPTKLTMLSRKKKRKLSLILCKLSNVGSSIRLTINTSSSTAMLRGRSSTNG